VGGLRIRIGVDELRKGGRGAKACDQVECCLETVEVKGKPETGSSVPRLSGLVLWARYRAPRFTAANGRCAANVDEGAWGRGDHCQAAWILRLRPSSGLAEQGLPKKHYR